ncbi:hypothetical protein D5086_018153 [Populus alba]|uniref:Uncharacterized protein n=1 Tax=Populus alba TaxID=43335 RepID=A0ACC4BNW6_POPAL
MAVRHKDLRILIGRPRLETRLRRFLGLASLSLVEVSGLLLQISCWLSCLYEEDNPTSSNNSLSFPLSQEVARGELNSAMAPYPDGCRDSNPGSIKHIHLLAGTYRLPAGLSFKVGYDGRSSEL